LNRRNIILLAALSAALLQGCAPAQVADENVPIDDFIVVSELEPTKVARFRHQYNYKQLTEHYIVLVSRDDYYLVEFRRRCRELNMLPIEPDIRYERNTLRAGVDSIRGCYIRRIFAIDKTQAEELENIGTGP
jgi:hypothetical protein